MLSNEDYSTAVAKQHTLRPNLKKSTLSLNLLSQLKFTMCHLTAQEKYHNTYGFFLILYSDEWHYWNVEVCIKLISFSKGISAKLCFIYGDNE